MNTKLIGDLLGDVGGSIFDEITTGLNNFFGMIVYYLVSFVCYFVQVIYKLFGIFSGTEKVFYDGDSNYLISIFFSNKTVNNVYWGMALLGFAIMFAFAIAAVIRKIFDINDKNQRSLGTILLGTFKSLLVILVTTMCMTAAINAVNILITQVTYIFDNADSLDQKNTIVFTDDEYAAMARVYNTIGNYSLSPSYDSRYNINCCFNEVRGDLYYLQQQGVFDYYYQSYDSSNKEMVTWQSLLQDLYQAGDVRYDLPLDVYNGNVTEAITNIIDEMKKNPSFSPLASYKKQNIVTELIPIDRVIFLMGTLDSANNEHYNINPSLTDDVRGPFYLGKKDIYDFDEVSAAFDISLLGGVSYIMILIMCYYTIKNLLNCIFSCITRMISLIGLYITAPPFAATIPLDDGERFKQWLNATVVQMFGIFGNIIPMRLMILLLPMVFSDKLVLLRDSAVLDMIAKGVLIIGMMEALGRFSGIFNGILSNNGAYASAMSTNMQEFSGRQFGRLKALTGVQTVENTLNERVFGSSGEHYGILGAAKNLFRTESIEQRNYSKDQREKQRQREKEEEASRRSGGSGGSGSSGGRSSAGSLPSSNSNVSLPSSQATGSSTSAGSGDSGPKAPPPPSMVGY